MCLAGLDQKRIDSKTMGGTRGSVSGWVRRGRASVQSRGHEFGCTISRQTRVQGIKLMVCWGRSRQTRFHDRCGCVYVGWLDQDRLHWKGLGRVLQG